MTYLWRYVILTYLANQTRGEACTKSTLQPRCTIKQMRSTILFLLECRKLTQNISELQTVKSKRLPLPLIKRCYCPTGLIRFQLQDATAIHMFLLMC